MRCSTSKIIKTGVRFVWSVSDDTTFGWDAVRAKSSRLVFAKLTQAGEDGPFCWHSQPPVLDNSGLIYKAGEVAESRHRSAIVCISPKGRYASPDCMKSSASSSIFSSFDIDATVLQELMIVTRSLWGRSGTFESHIYVQRKLCPQIMVLKNLFLIAISVQGRSDSIETRHLHTQTQQRSLHFHVQPLLFLLFSPFLLKSTDWKHTIFFFLHFLHVQTLSLEDIDNVIPKTSVWKKEIKLQSTEQGFSNSLPR